RPAGGSRSTRPYSASTRGPRLERTRRPGPARGATVSTRGDAPTDPGGRVRARVGTRGRPGRDAGHARRHVPGERARRGEAGRLGPSRVELLLARPRRPPAVGGAE